MPSITLHQISINGRKHPSESTTSAFNVWLSITTIIASPTSKLFIKSTSSIWRATWPIKKTLQTAVALNWLSMLSKNIRQKSEARQKSRLDSKTTQRRKFSFSASLKPSAAWNDRLKWKIELNQMSTLWIDSEFWDPWVTYQSLPKFGIAPMEPSWIPKGNAQYGKLCSNNMAKKILHTSI